MSKLDETVPGGRYFDPKRGLFVDAHGTPLKKEEPKAAPKPAVKKTAPKTAKKK